MSNAAPHGSSATAVKRLLGHAVVYGLARVALSGLDLLFTPLYARALAPADFGLIAIGISLQAGLGIAYTLGLDGALFRLFYTPGSQEEDRRRVVGGIVAGVSVVAIGVACLLTLVGPAAFGGLLGGMSRDVFLLVVWGSVLNVYPLLVLQLLQMQQQSHRYLWMASGYAVARGLATVFAVGVLQHGPRGWAEAFAISAGIVAVFAVAILRRHARIDQVASTLRAAIDYALPQLIHQASGWLAVAASRPILATLLPLAQVAVYQVAYSIGQGLGLLTTAINLAYGPAFMEAAARSETEASARFGRFATRYIALLIILAGVGSLWRDLVVRLVAGPTYGAATAIVPIVLAAFVLQGIYLTLATPVFWRKESVRRLPARTISSAVAGVAGIALLVPPLGVAGAALAALLANLVLVVAVYPLAQRALFMKYEHRVIAKAVLLVVLAVASSYGVKLLADGMTPLVVVLGTATAVLTWHAAALADWRPLAGGRPREAS